MSQDEGAEFWLVFYSILDLDLCFACVEKLLALLKLKNKDEHAIILKSYVYVLKFWQLPSKYQYHHIKAEFQMNDNSLLQKSNKTFFAPFMIILFFLP
jgi:hypothetical protein